MNSNKLILRNQRLFLSLFYIPKNCQVLLRHPRHTVKDTHRDDAQLNHGGHHVSWHDSLALFRAHHQNAGLEHSSSDEVNNRAKSSVVTLSKFYDVHRPVAWMQAKKHCILQKV
jgi:hypothetical protein